MNAVEQAEVKRIAKLAHLELSTAEIQSLSHDLNEILQYVEQLDSVDTSGVEPLSHVHEVVNQMRPDELRPSLPRDQVFRNAPDSDGTYFKVPRVIKD